MTWMAQFQTDEDVGAAKRLLQLLDLVTGSDVDRKLFQLLKTFAQHNQGDFAIFSLRDITKAERATHYFGQFDNDKPAKIAPAFGSEGRMGHFTRDMAKHLPTLHDHPSISDMRRHRIRWIVLVDDNLSSGTRAATMVKHFYQHETIRSWHSFGWVQFAVLS